MTTATVEAIKAKNLQTMRDVTKMLKDEQRSPKRMTKEVPAAKLLKEVGIKKESKTACAQRLIETYKTRDEFVKMLQGHFPDLSEFNARCYFNKFRQG
jgi:hypothetical protein